MLYADETVREAIQALNTALKLYIEHRETSAKTLTTMKREVKDSDLDKLILAAGKASVCEAVLSMLETYSSDWSDVYD